MDTEVYVLESADFDPFTGRVVLRFRGLAPIQIQAPLTALRHLRAAVSESVTRLSRSEESPEDSTSTR
jgi:hypothetical protein